MIDSLETTGETPTGRTIEEMIGDLLALPKEKRSAAALQPQFVRAAAGLGSLSPDLADLREQLKAAGVALKAWDSAVKIAGRRRGADDADDRPTIRIVTGELHETITAGIAALASDESIYHREGKLVHVVRSDDTSGPLIHDLELDTLRERLTRASRWEHVDARVQEWKPSEPTDHVTRGIAARKRYDPLRRLDGVVEHPVPRPDGSILQTPGYDAATGLLYAPSVDFPVVPENPTHSDAVIALVRLLDVFVDFPYRERAGHPDDAAAGRSVALAGLFTLMGRSAIRGAVPAFLFDANSPASGKSLHADVISAIALGRPTSVKNYPSRADDADTELNKVLCGWALDGSRLANFDNVDGGVAFGGSAIEGCLTARDKMTFRLLGVNKNPQLPVRFVIFASGNNIVVSRDCERRVLVARLESRYENPEDRPASTFAHPERIGVLVDWAITNRASLVCDVLTVIRAFFAAGCPREGRKAMASFEAWSSLVADALVWAGAADPTLCRPMIEGAQNPEKQAMGVVVRHWARLDPAGLTIATALSALYPPDRIRGRSADGSPLAPDGFEDLREAIEALSPRRQGQAPDANQLGRMFRKFRGSNVGGGAIDNVGDARGGVARWGVVAASPTAGRP